MEQNSHKKQDDLLDFSEFDIDSLDTPETNVKKTQQETSNDQTSIQNTDNGLLEFDIDESLLNQVTEPVDNSSLDISDSTYADNQKHTEQQVKNQDFEFEFDLQDEMEDKSTDLTLKESLNTSSVTTPPIINEPESNNLNNDNASTDFSELSLEVEKIEPSTSELSLSENIQSPQQSTPQPPPLQNNSPFNLPNDDDANTGTHFGQSVGTIKARPPEENPYQASQHIQSEEFDGYYEEEQNTWYHISGRIGRLRYLTYQSVVGVLSIGVVLLLTLVGSIFGSLFGGGDGGGLFVLGFIVLLLLLMPFMVFTNIIYPIRRLHDLNLTGWLCVIGFIPYVNILLFLYLIFAPGQDGVNNYGNPPRENRTIHYLGAFSPILIISMIGILAAIALPAYQDYVDHSNAATIENVE